jgi:hypothetical protein
MRRQREGLAELRQFVEYADPKYLADHVDLLVAPLGLSQQQAAELHLLEPDELARQLRGLVDHRRAASRAARAREAEERAMVAAAALGRSAEWHGPTARVDPRLLLGDLPGHPTAKLIGFEGPGWVIALSKAKLREARGALGRIPGLEALVDTQGLHVRWHGGRGGIDLYPQPVGRHSCEPAVLVRLASPAEHAVEWRVAVQQRSPKTATTNRRGGAWLGQVLTDLGLLG